MADGHPPPRNASLDTLRALAVTLVLFAHLAAWRGDLPVPAAVGVLGERGVDLFFVMSGFLIGGIVLRELDGGAFRLGRFWRNRWFRTLPAYYATLGLYLLKELVPHRSAGLTEPLAYVVFLQSYALGPLPDYAHSWSLCVEEHFYLVLPVLFLALRRAGVRRTRTFGMAILAVGMVLLAARFGLAAAGWSSFERLSHNRTDALVAGVCLAAWWKARPETFSELARRPLAATALAAGLLVVGAVFTLRESAWWQTMVAVAMFATVALAVARIGFLETLGSTRPVRWMARVSYSMYLLHPLVFGAAYTLFVSKHLDRPLILLAAGAVCLVGSGVAAEIMYRLVEKPMLRWRDSFGRAATEAPATERRA